MFQFDWIKKTKNPEQRFHGIDWKTKDNRFPQVLNPLYDLKVNYKK